MNKLLEVLAVVAAALGVICLAILMVDLLSANPRMHRVDCSLASFHPDYTTKQRQQCRGEA